MNLTQKMENAKNDYVKVINEVTEKYELDICLVELEIAQIYNEILRIKQEQLKEVDNNAKDNICK